MAQRRVPGTVPTDKRQPGRDHRRHCGESKVVRRLPESQKGAAEIVKSLRGVPWRPDGNVEEEWAWLRVRVAVPNTVVSREQLPPPVVDDIAARHVYIRRNVELKKFGFTERCPGCHAAKHGGVSANHSAECRGRIVRAMRADEELSKRVLEAERRVLRAAGVRAAEEEGPASGAGAHAAPGGSKTEEGDAVMGDDVRAIDDAEALRVWSELSDLDPNLRGDTYVSEDGGQWNFIDLVDDLRVMRERIERERERDRERERERERERREKREKKRCRWKRARREREQQRKQQTTQRERPEKRPKEQ
eukprot:782766-Amphidinium_carterae.2